MSSSTLPEVIHLSNGVPVVLQHFDGWVASLYWWNQVGSADERADQAGFAHFLEHMLFKDTSAKETGKPSEGKIAMAIESFGGDINAYTSFDQTVYHVTCAEEHLEKIAAVFGQMAKPQSFLKEDFEREREVILEELRRNDDSPERQASQELFTKTFSRHPYGRPVIGFQKILKAARVKDLEAFYRQHYMASNMGLIVVGPIHDEKGKRKKGLIQILEKHFGSKNYPRKPEYTVNRSVESEFRKKDTVSMKPFDVRTPSFLFSFRVPELSHQDIPALDMLTGILGMGEVSRLYQKLFYQTQLVTDVSAGLYIPKDPGLMYFQLDFSETKNIGEVVRTAFDELVQLRNQGPKESEFERIIVNEESEKLYATQSTDGIAGRLGFLNFIVKDLHFDQLYLERLKSVTVEQVRDVAEKYLDPRRMTSVLLAPKKDLESKSYEKEIHEWVKKSLGTSKVVARPSAPSKKVKALTRAVPEVQTFQTNSGIRICYVNRPLSNVVSIHGSVLGGIRLEKSTDLGVSYLLGQTWNKGTQKHSAKELASIIEGRAASLDGFSGRNSVGLECSALARDWNVMKELFEEILIQATFPEQEVDQSKRVILDQLRSLEDHSSQLCFKLFLETLFEHHPYGHLVYGSESTVSQLSNETLKHYHRSWIHPKNLVVSVSGRIKEDSLHQWVEELDQSLGKKNPFNAPVQTLVPDEEYVLKAPRWVERSLGRGQVHIVVGYLGTKVTSKDRFAIRLLQTVLGGQSGRLFIELREKKSLAYTVSPVSFEGVEKGYVGTYIACSPEKKDQAIEGIKKVYEAFVKKGPTAAELARGKQFLLGRRAMELQSDSALAAHYGLQTLYGLGTHADEDMKSEIDRLTSEDLRKICKKYFIDQHAVTAIVG